MKLTTHKNNILFRFLDPVNSKGEFERPKTSFGLELLAGFDNSAKEPRWVEVLAVGPDVKDVKVGDQILLPALRWTERVVFEGDKYWKTNESEVVCRRDPATPSWIQAMNSFILFNPATKKKTVSDGGIIVAGSLNDDELHKGAVFKIGPDVIEEIAGGTIYYDGNKFFEYVESHVDRSFAFIKEDNVLLYEAVETE